MKPSHGMYVYQFLYIFQLKKMVEKCKRIYRFIYFLIFYVFI